MSAQEGVFEQKESRIFKNLIRLDSLRARDIMTPRTVMVAYQENTPLTQIERGVEDLHVSRIPVYGATQEVVTGYVLKADLLVAIARKRTDGILSEYKRDILVLPDSLPLGKLFDRMLEK